MTKKVVKRCPTCNHIVDDRVLRLNQTLITALFRVWRWCEDKGRFRFDRKEIAHLLTGETMVATFGDLMYFGGILYRPEGGKRGEWAINRERAMLFFANKNSIYTRIVFDRVTNEIIEKTEPLFLRQIPKLTEFLDKDYKFMPEYQEGDLSKTL